MSAESVLTRENQSYESQLLRLLVDIRFAAGDDGKRMQPELVEHIAALRKDAERFGHIRMKVYASNATGEGSYRFHYDRLPAPLSNPLKGSVAQHFEQAIDAAIMRQTNA